MTRLNKGDDASGVFAKFAEQGAVPADWREQLVVRLGQRPRRIGVWAELALYGARLCLDEHLLEQLPDNAALRVVSTTGPSQALAHAWQACAENTLPMPFDFLQSQPSQMLVALCQHLQWQGDALFMAHEKLDVLLTAIQHEASILRTQSLDNHAPWGGLLFGYVDLVPTPRSQWCLIK
jgi:hypothetical protein